MENKCGAPSGGDVRSSAVTRRNACRAVPLAVVVGVLVVLAACGAVEKDEVVVDDSVPSPSSSAGEATTTTSTTATPPSTVYAPDTLEGEVEAAYLAAWDAFADACASASTDGLDTFYADEALGYRTESLRQLSDRGAVGECLVDHQYNIGLIAEDTAAVVDNYVNHMRLIDPQTGSYLEPDPNVRDGSVYTVEKRDEAWIITDINGLESS